MNKKKRTLFKTAVLGVTAIATSLTIGMSAACSTSGNDGSTSDKDDDKTTTKIDAQTIKNGNFEYYSDNDGLYLISTPDNWSSGTKGSSLNSMSGVINTVKERWEAFTDPDLPKTLEDNDDLEAGDENKKDYHGMLADDLPYKNTHTATDETNKDDGTKDYIGNPYTYKYSYDDTCGEDEILVDGVKTKFYTDDDGNLFLDEDFEQPLETSVLMLHNFRKSDYYGGETYYTSSTTVSLEANTAAEISLWVKTTEMYFGGSSSDRESAKIEFDRGAYIKVNTQVGGNSLDAFEIKNINTELLNPNGDDNGWVKYTVYVAASSFATTSVNLTLGLGEDDANTVEGYAFFDDVTIKKYNSVGVMEERTEFGSKIRTSGDNPNVSYPLKPDAQNEFRVDIEKYQTEDKINGGVKPEEYENNFADRHFFIDFASYNANSSLALSSQTVTAGLTVDETKTGKYVCTEYSADNKYKTNLTAVDYAETYIPNGLRSNGININDDILVTTTVGGNDWSFSQQSGITTEYDNILTDALKTAKDLPYSESNPDALVMLSARGAAYEAHITNDDSFTLGDGKYMLVSFWIKTSDMKGNTAATVTVKDLSDEKNSSSFTIDSTTQGKVTIGEGVDKIEDAYKGWTRCFVRVANTSKDKDTDKKFEIVVNFGNTSIRDTSTRSSYKAGWVALTNLSVMELDEDVYGYTSGLSHTATLGFTEKAENTSNRFDTEQGEKNEIKTDLATPSSYTGVNGNSKFINRDTTIDIDGYHDTNKNDYAGLLSKDNVANYATNDCMWYNALKAIEADNETPDKLWNAVFGERTVQPLLIVNTVREKKDGTNSLGNKIYNYGYIGNSASVSANSYKAVSVRVKASAGAIANVYLVEDKTGGEVLTYATPTYNFWYDADGNILKGEPAEDETKEQKKANIAYTLRKDGLYENGDGKLYANFYNLTKQYDLSFEHESYYDESGELVKFEKLVKGETYYANAAKSAYAPHYLIAGGKDNNKVYLYSGEGTGEAATYYYMEDGAANRSKVVYGVDKSIARYVNDEAPDTPYFFTIEGDKYAGKWVTVTFYIHAGAEAKSYKLELWSGKRDEESSYEGADDSYVIFDYSDLSSSLNQSTFDGLVGGYTEDIIEEYKKNIETELDDNDLNIADLEKIASEEGATVEKLYGYEAGYYTFSLYDSEAFIPFNGETDTSGTGYSFDYTESKESLTFLKVVDNGLPYGSSDTDNAIYTMSAFIDYSVIDKDVDILNEPTAPGASDSSSNQTSSSGDTANVWLLASSIILVVAIFVAIAAIFIRDFFRTHKGKKSSSKNSYNFNKNKRYVRKYVKANGEAPEIEEGTFDESLMSDKSEEVEVEEPATEETPSSDEEVKPEDDGKEE